MRILYISVLASQAALEEAQKKDKMFSTYAVHKFNRLVVEGLVRNGVRVTALSTFYQPNVGLGYFRKKEKQNGVNYQYIPTVNNQIIRRVWLIVYCFFRVLFWGVLNKKEKAIICDVLNISACIGAVTAAKLIGLRNVGVMTDMPGIGVSTTTSAKEHDKVSFSAKINKSYLGKFSHYVFLTEQMNEAVNVNRRPYIVMEGLVDADMKCIPLSQKYDQRVIIYAGGLHERYGLKLLVEAFIKANIDNTELWIYGKGPFAEQLEDYQQLDKRIVYKGVVSNWEVVESEIKATLLVNPRPTGELFTKYSFPSKNMEYMVSGTPVLTTPLQGMPKEYYPYVYLFDSGETIEGYAEVLARTLSLSTEELRAKGLAAREWVLKNKNHLSQTKRIVELLNQ